MWMIHALSVAATQTRPPSDATKVNFLLVYLPLGAVFFSWVLQEIGSHLKEQKQRRRKTKVLASALSAELVGLFRRYTSTIGQYLGAAATPEELEFGFTPVQFNYFAVFDSNAAKSGLLKIEDATELVSLYVLAQGHFQDLITWTTMTPHNTVPAARLSAFRLMKQSHDELMIKFPQLVANLNAYPV
jgi:hypothetical protein